MDQTLRNRPRDLGQSRGRFITERFGRELRAERIGSGLSQRELGRRVSISQARISQIERGRGTLSIGIAARLAAGVGAEVGMRLYPAQGVRLRDSGQLRLAEAIQARLPASTQVTLEAPIGVDAHDLRAADMLVRLREGTAMIEIERVLTDLQAQLRRAQLKRRDLALRVGREVALVLAVSDTLRNRAAVAPFATLIASALPAEARTLWRALQAGDRIPADGLLWIRERERHRRRSA